MHQNAKKRLIMQSLSGLSEDKNCFGDSDDEKMLVGKNYFSDSDDEKMAECTPPSSPQDSPPEVSPPSVMPPVLCTIHWSFQHDFFKIKNEIPKTKFKIGCQRRKDIF